MIKRHTCMDGAAAARPCELCTETAAAVKAPGGLPALDALLDSFDEWLGNSEGLMTEDIIEWRDQLAKAIGRPSLQERHDAANRPRRYQIVYRNGMSAAATPPAPNVAGLDAQIWQANHGGWVRWADVAGKDLRGEKE